MMEEPMRPTTCDRCGEPFNTSDVHPRRYCSIACEEGRTPLPISDPSSEGFHIHLRNEPADLIGCALVTRAIKRTCYSPDWHRSPEDYKRHKIISHDTEEEILVYKTTNYLGRVEDMSDGMYHISRETEDGHRMISVPVSDVVNFIRAETWWAER